MSCALSIVNAATIKPVTLLVFWLGDVNARIGSAPQGTAASTNYGVNRDVMDIENEREGKYIDIAPLCSDDD